jgi:hypothetical protein
MSEVTKNCPWQALGDSQEIFSIADISEIEKIDDVKLAVMELIKRVRNKLSMLCECASKCTILSCPLLKEPNGIFTIKTKLDDIDNKLSNKSPTITASKLVNIYASLFTIYNQLPSIHCHLSANDSQLSIFSELLSTIHLELSTLDSQL